MYQTETHVELAAGKNVAVNGQATSCCAVARQFFNILEIKWNPYFGSPSTCSSGQNDQLH